MYLNWTLLARQAKLRLNVNTLPMYVSFFYISGFANGNDEHLPSGWNGESLEIVTC